MTHTYTVYEIMITENFRLLGILVEIQFYSVLMEEDHLELRLPAY
jgi:hypothetical protein